MSVPTVPINPGDVIDGNYRVERLLGLGGMGAVFVAHEERLNRRVAIKVLLDSVAKSPEAVTRFEREARSAAALQSDHVTRVLSVGHLASGSPYIVMELMEGEDLASLLAKRGALPPAEVVGYMVQACEALSEAHALGIVHRDLKPANMFLAKRPVGPPRLKLLDFGISKGANTASGQALTKTTALMGTPMYMSPEQLREVRNVDGRADVWALGIMMYELLSGAPPFQSDALAELCVLIMTTKHPPLSTRCPGISPALEAIVNRCLQKEAGERFATAHELATALSTASLDASSQATSASGEQPSLPAMLPRMATPRMSPRLETNAIAERQRMQAPTAAQAASGYAPNLPSPPTPAGAQPPHVLHTNPMAGPPARAVSAATVDPVSNTQPWLPPKRPSILGLALIALAGLAVGAVVLYVAVLRPTSGTTETAAASGLISSAPNGSASAPNGSASATASATAAAQIADSASTAAVAAASAPAPRVVPFAPIPPPLANPGVPPPGARIVDPDPRERRSPGAPLPPPGLALPPPGGVVVPTPLVVPPIVTHAPSSKPPAGPPPGSLMPGARN